MWVKVIYEGGYFLGIVDEIVDEAHTNLMFTSSTWYTYDENCVFKSPVIPTTNTTLIKVQRNWKTLRGCEGMKL